jgi:hypothetical protein
VLTMMVKEGCRLWWSYGGRGVEAGREILSTCSFIVSIRVCSLFVKVVSYYKERQRRRRISRKAINKYAFVR